MSLYFSCLPVLFRSCIFFLVCSLFSAATADAQLPAFNPAPQNESKLKSLEQQFEAHYKASLEQLPAKNKKEYAALYEQRWENIKSKLDKKEIYTAAFAQQYLDNLVQVIVKANPLLQQQPVHCYFSRSGVPNASYIGEGIILFNMGLFKALENESQVAFVLCHELAHYYLQHSENGIARYVATMNGKDMQEELRKIKASEYRQREQLEKLLKGVTFNNRRHSRDHESEADSMGLVFMQHTPFSLEGALTALTLLDKIDVDTMNTAAQLEQLFNAKDYPFRKRWIAKREGLLGGHAKLEKDSELSDSLKTHPDCKLRIKLMEPYVKANQSGNRVLNITGKVKFDSLRHAFKYEVIAYAYENDNYTRSLYYTLSMLQESPRDPYLVTQVGRILNSCYDAQKLHTLGKRIELPSPDNPANYNVLLQMMKRKRVMSHKMTSHIVGINFVTRKKVFDLDGDEDEFRLLPSSIHIDKKSGNFIIAGTYFDKDANVGKDASKGMAFYVMSTNGKIISKAYNSWEKDFSKYFHSNSKGKIDNVGYLFIHNMIQDANGKLYVVGEGYKRQASAGGIALKVLSTAGGGSSNIGATKIVITDMVVMTFDDQFKVTDAKIYNKTNNTATNNAVSDFNSQHLIAMYLKSIGAFDYDFTTGDEDNDNFSICYSDYVRSADYKGQTFNIIRFNGTKFVTDKMQVKSKASRLKIFPAKPGSVMILEYFKKDKRIDIRLEKIS